MKRSLLLVCGFVAAAGLAVGGTSFASAAPQGAFATHGTYHITFDGFCDGMTLNVPGNGGPNGVDGQHVGSCNGTYGMIGLKVGGHVFVTDYTGIAFGYMLVYQINTDHTWSNWYDCSGSNAGVECFLNAGTWSVGIPAAPAKGISSATLGR